ncbi:hypothetical protein VDG1235_4613 [Verrucomicrobiia bacterium DG1235]|nr:hypothetical protein VDG1235_4613 [Verrucomicrobiae bacterium DG1235]
MGVRGLGCVVGLWGWLGDFLATKIRPVEELRYSEVGLLDWFGEME